MTVGFFSWTDFWLPSAEVLRDPSASHQPPLTPRPHCHQPCYQVGSCLAVCKPYLTRKLEEICIYVVFVKTAHLNLVNSKFQLISLASVRMFLKPAFASCQRGSQWPEKDGLLRHWRRSGRPPEEPDEQLPPVHRQPAGNCLTRQQGEISDVADCRLWFGSISHTVWVTAALKVP